jgi:hypothetical protein
MKTVLPDLNIKPGYDDKLTPELLDLFRPLDALNICNSFIADNIIKEYELNPSVDEKRNLETYVYIARHLLQKERELEHHNKMIADGWLPLTDDAIREVYSKYGREGRIQVNADKDCDWLTLKVDNTFKVFVTVDNKAYLMKPRASTKGISISYYRNAFYKVVNK